MKPTLLASLGELVWDTFRQAQASGISWMMLTLTAVCVLFCASVDIAGDVKLHGGDGPPLFLPPPSPRVVFASVVAPLGSTNPLEAAAFAAACRKTWFESSPEFAKSEGVDVVAGRMTLGFGVISIAVARERADSVRFLELVLAAGAAGGFGVLLALIWTAGFAPTFLEPSAAAVLLAKPVPRWQLLVGKYLGVVAFVGCWIVFFIAATWLALGLRTGVWDFAYWRCIPLLLLQFAVFYAFSILLAVVTQSTVACVFGSFLFWLLSWGINYARVMILGLRETHPAPGATSWLAEMAYWITPKPIDASLMFFDALDAGQHFELPEAFRILQTSHAFSPTLSVLSTFVIAAALLALAAHEFNSKDY
jgi:ABC-type transport system involved in multi-copper enzyme maturation permease subunit